MGKKQGNPSVLRSLEDPIIWSEHPIGALYKKLFAMRKKNTALWNAKWGARMTQVVNTAPTQVLSFVRQNEKDKVFAVFNFSDKHQNVTFRDALFHGKYTDFISGEAVTMTELSRLDLAPWEYHVFIK